MRPPLDCRCSRDRLFSLNCIDLARTRLDAAASAIVRGGESLVEKQRVLSLGWLEARVQDLGSSPGLHPGHDDDTQSDGHFCDVITIEHSRCRHGYIIFAAVVGPAARTPGAYSLPAAVAEQHMADDCIERQSALATRGRRGRRSRPRPRSRPLTLPLALTGIFTLATAAVSIILACAFLQLAKSWPPWLAGLQRKLYHAARGVVGRRYGEPVSGEEKPLHARRH